MNHFSGVVVILMLLLLLVFDVESVVWRFFCVFAVHSHFIVILSGTAAAAVADHCFYRTLS